MAMQPPVEVLLRFEWEAIIPKDENLWVPTRFTASNGQKTHTQLIRNEISEQIGERLQRDDDLDEYLTQRKAEILFRTSFQVVGYTRELLDVNCRDIRVELLEDLFMDRSTGRTVGALVHLSTPKVSRKEYLIYEKVVDDGDEDEAEMYQYLRVGSGKVREEDKDDVLRTPFDQGVVAQIDRKRKKVALALVDYPRTLGKACSLAIEKAADT